MDEAQVHMLKVMLMLMLGGVTPEASPFDLRELGDAIEGGNASLDDVEAMLLLADTKELGALGDELGSHLIGMQPEDFEERLGDLFDDERFAELIGRFVTITARMADKPELARIIEAKLEPPGSPLPGTIQYRFIRDIDPLTTAFDTETSLEWLRGQRTQLEAVGILQMDEAVIGRQVLDDVYDPSATPTMAAISRSLVRMIARMIVVRHVASTKQEPAAAFVDGVFEKSAQDVQNLGSFLASTMGQESTTGFLPIDLRLERVMHRLNQWRMKQAMQIPRGWALESGSGMD